MMAFNAGSKIMINDQLILEEDYDENYQPSEAEILEYANVLGIDPMAEPHLMWIAREGFNAPLPENWKPCQDPSEDIYYFNFATGESTWDHPCDEFYKNMVSEERRKLALGQNKSATPKKEARKKKEKAEKSSNLKHLGPLKAEQSKGIPSVHRAGKLGPLKSSDGLAGSSSLGPVRGSVGSSQPIRSSMNTTTGSMQSNKSINITSSMSLPIYSTDLEQEGHADERPKRIPDFEAQDIAALGYEDSEGNVDRDSNSNSDNDSYHKDVDFGISKNLSELLLTDMKNVDEEALRGSLEKDSQSLKSTGRDESALSPLDFTDDDRKRKAEKLADAASRRVELKDEETKTRSQNDKVLTELKKRLGRELENEKLELLEEKSTKLRKIKSEMKQEQVEAERKLRAEREGSIRELEERLKEEAESRLSKLNDGTSDEIKTLREECERKEHEEKSKLWDEMNRNLEKLREEVRSLTAEEQNKLQDEKRKALDRINQQVSDAISGERRRLEDEQTRQIEKLKSGHAQELEDTENRLEKKHRNMLDAMRAEMEERHKKTMESLDVELKQLQEEDLERQKHELDAARKRQKAIDDLDKGLDEVLQERRTEMKQIHQKEKTRLAREHENELKRLQDEYAQKIEKLKKSLATNLDTETKKLKRQFEREIEEIKRQFSRKKESLQDQLEDEEEELKEKSAALDRKQKEIEKALKNLQLQENKLEERKKTFAEDREKFEQHQDEVFGTTQNLSVLELERMREERKQLQSEIRMERDELENVKTDKRKLETDVLQLRMTIDQNTHKLKELRQKLDKKSDEMDKLHKRITDAIDEEETSHAQNYQSSMRLGNTTAGRLSIEDLGNSNSDEEEIFKPVKSKKKTKRTHVPSSFASNMEDLFSDDESVGAELIAVGIRSRLKKESGSIELAKAFLRKQRQSLKRRQAAVAAARQQLALDFAKMKQGGDGGGHILEDVRSSLETEAREVDEMMSHLQVGSQLIHEKEHKLNMLHNLNREPLSDEELEFSPFEHAYPPASLAPLDLTDDDASSGVSSNDFNLEQFIQGLSREPSSQHVGKLASSPHTVRPPLGDQKSQPDIKTIAGSLKKINSELSRVLSAIGSQSTPSLPVQAPVYTPPDMPASHVPIYVPHPPSVQSSNLTSLNPYITNPQHHVDYSRLVSSAEVSLERKWRKYFGDRRPPMMTSASILPSSTAVGPGPVRDQLRQFRLSLLESSCRAPSTVDRLAEHKDWLRRFHQADVTFGASVVKASAGSDAGSVTSIGVGSEHRFSEPLSSSSPVRHTVPPRFNLDENNEVRVTQY
ncbi:centrosomal protein of 164 kDa-like isoform X2 [Gigantopelta aegis]|uniref:centrosomal protein of 164 kDa-like isoform X2 n=1 Tax=Gigantopelta aegis TaxID=1735272 RepID=UPI001B88A01B|nr:centrosomal protein of 164 kDa-like isoform X2 [Gigantopelta aegis]